ncbi:MAG: phage major capsid protein [Coriobacteriaceae bacterium]|nr:phage major capsid protein [Coriobacteriaceae bacterium]
MTQKSYQEDRKALMEEVDHLSMEGTAEEINAKVAEVNALDAQWEEIKKALANARALEETPAPVDISTLHPTPQADTMVDTTAPTAATFTAPEDTYKTEAYTNAWAKRMMGLKLNADEDRVYQIANEYTHTTQNTGEVIPDTVAQGIWSEVEDLYPYYADITKTSVKGLLTIIKAKETTDAAWYDENTATEDAEETFETATLGGCELSRAVTISWKLKEMAIPDFIAYITRRMAERMGAALGYGIVNGQGPTADKPEPTGIITALTADGNQVVKYSGEIAYDDLTAARSKIKSGYAPGLAIYANASTIWNQLANIKDNNGRPILMNDVSAEGGVTRILGLVVKEDASIPDGSVLFSNASRGYQANINTQVTVATEDHVKARTTDYVAYAIVDGAPLTLLAHALLQGE